MKFERLGNIAEIKTGKYDVNHATDDGQYTFYTCAMGQFKSATYSFEGETIILPGNGANVGEVFFNESDKFEAYQRTYVIQNIKAFPKFVFYYFKSFWKNSLRNAQYGSATNYIRLNNITDFRIPLPSHENQLHIANILTRAETLINQRKESIRLLDEFLKSTFLEMFGDPVRNEKGFKKTELGKLGIWKSGGTPSRTNKGYFNGSIPWLTSGELNEMFVSDSKERISEDGLRNSNASEIPTNSLLLGMYDTAALKSSINLRVVTCNQAISFSRLDDTLCNTVFIYYSIQIGKEYFRSQQRGVRQKNMNLSMIKSIKIALPPLDLQTQFAQIVEKTEALKVRYQSSLQELENLYGSLSQRAFKGELGVKEEDLLMAAETGTEYRKGE